jgi:hypothetical protein
MNIPHPEDPDIMLEYDFSGPDVVIGKYAKFFPDGRDSVIVKLDPDIAERFPDATAVNEALRVLAQLEGTAPADKSKRANSLRATA